MRKRVKLCVVLTAFMIFSLSLTGCGEDKPVQTGEEYILPEKSENVADTGTKGTDDVKEDVASGDDASGGNNPFPDTADRSLLPNGTKAVKDPETGEIRYRLRDEDPDDPRTYTYEQVWQEEVGDYAEGREYYDKQDAETVHHVKVTNIDALSDFYDDGYFVANMPIFLSNYLYYFTGEKDKFYTATIRDGNVTNSDNGRIVFKVILDEYPDEVIYCEYHPVYNLFGFKSGIGDMSLEVQFDIAEEGNAVSRETLLAHQPTVEDESEESTEE